MSDIDRLALDTLFQTWRKERAPKVEVSRAFERFVVDQILKDYVPTDEDLDAGDMGGSDDGGIDAMHLIMNGVLLGEDSDVPQPTTSVELVLVQAKAETGFSETAVQKIQSFCDDLLNWNRDPETLNYINPFGRDHIARFRQRYQSVWGHRHTLTISVHYATKATDEPRTNDKIRQRVENLRGFIKSRLSQAQVDFYYWGCPKLLAVAREIPKQERVLEIHKHFPTDDGSLVCLARLPAYYAFITDDHGRLRTDMLEPNVRDYQGVRNSVNSQIRESLASPEDEDFWWLNNGITVLSTNCSVSGNKLQLTAPEIVNGLQTSSEIYGVFSAGGEKAGGATADTRSVLVRVIVSSSDISRDKVIKATNNQTPVEPLSLRATDRLHFDIEDRLNLFSVFYDRKKGKYKRLQKPIADIVGMKTVSQAVMAIALRRPEDARGRPGTILKDEASYDLVFNEAYPRDLYVVCVLIDRQVDQFLAGTHKNLRRDIRYCSDTLVACLLAGSPEPTVDQLAALVPKVRRVSEAFISEACNAVYAVYVSLGDTDKVAKSRDLWANVVKDFAALKARIA